MTGLRAPETSIVPIALNIYNATHASASTSPEITNSLISASIGDFDAGPSIAMSRLNAPRDGIPELDHVDEREPSPFDFDALFTATNQIDPDTEDELEDDYEDDDEPKRSSILAAITSRNGANKSDKIQLVALGFVIAAVLGFIGVQANKSDPHVETPLAFEDQPGFPTQGTLSIAEFNKRVKPTLFELPATVCNSAPVAVAISRDRLIAPSSAVEPSQNVTINFKGEKITGQVVGGTRSPDLALIVLDERLDIGDGEIPPFAGPLEFSSPQATVYTNGKFRSLDASGAKAGWAGPEQGLRLDADVAHGSIAFLPSGRLVGMVSQRPAEPSIVQSSAAIEDALDRILADTGDEFGCAKTLQAKQGPVFGDAQWGRDEMNRPQSPVLEPFVQRCLERSYPSCDRLRNVAPYGSEYIEIARTCGGKRETAELGCNPTFGFHGSRDIAEPFEGACLALPRAERERAVISDCFEPHDAEVISVGPSADKCVTEAQRANTKLYWDRDLLVGSAKTPKNELVACFLYDPGYVLTEALPGL